MPNFPAIIFPLTTYYGKNENLGNVFVLSNSHEIQRNLFLEGSFGYVIIFNEDVLEGKSKLLGGYCCGKIKCGDCR